MRIFCNWKNKKIDGLTKELNWQYKRHLSVSKHYSSVLKAIVGKEIEKIDSVWIADQLEFMGMNIVDLENKIKENES